MAAQPRKRTAAIVHADLGPNPGLDDQDVLVQARGFADHLGAQGWSTGVATLGLDLGETARRLREIGPELVVNLVETVDGRDGLQYLGPALLDHLGLPYTGSPTHAVFLSAQKLEAKKVLRSAGIDTPAWVPLRDVPRVGPPGEPPWIVKPSAEHASRGIDDASVISDRAVLLARSRAAGAGGWFVERFIEGRELAVSLLAGEAGVDVLPPAEIDFSRYPPGKPRIVGYAAKWETGSFEYEASPRTFALAKDDARLVDDLARVALRCWEVCGLEGYARVDFRVDTLGRPWVLEVNANPCLSPDAGFAAAAENAGLTLETVLARIITDAIRRGA